MKRVKSLQAETQRDESSPLQSPTMTCLILSLVKIDQFAVIQDGQSSMASQWGVAADIEVGVYAADTLTTCRHAGGAGGQWRRGWMGCEVGQGQHWLPWILFLYLYVVEFLSPFPSPGSPSLYQCCRVCCWPPHCVQPAGETPPY